MIENDRSALLPQVMCKVATLNLADLQAVHRLILKLEFEALAEEIQDDADALQAAGKLEPELIDAAIREHRKRHPYP